MYHFKQLFVFMFYKFTSTILILLTKMKKITLLDFNQNQSVKPKRWYSLLAFSFIMLTCQIGLAQFTFPTISGPITITGGTDVVQNINNTANSAGVTAEDYEGFIVTVDWTNVDNAYSSEARLIVTTSSGSTAVLFPTSGSASNGDSTTITFEADFVGTYNPSANGLLGMTFRQSWSGSQANWNNIEITLVPAPDCIAPITLTATNITTNSATLGWISDGNLFDIEYGITGFTPTGNPTDASTTGVSNSFLLEDLDANTVYQFYVRQDCGAVDGLSEWTGPFSFRTQCNVFTAPTAVQTFTGYTGVAPATLDCWSEATGNFVDGITGTSSSWTNQDYNNSTNANGTAAYINLYGADNEWLVSPAIDLGDGSTPYRLEYNVSVIPWTGTDNVVDMAEKFVKVVVSTDGGLTWAEANVIKTYDNSNIPNSGGLSEVISLDGYTGIVKFAYYAFATEFTPDLRFFIDNWRVNIIPTCDAPTILTADEITSTGATLAWTSVGNNFDIEFGLAGFEQGGDDSTIVSDLTTNSYEVTVTEGGTYEFYVRQDCGDTNGISEWAGPFSFNIPLAGEDCSAPIVVTTLPYTTTDDTANYGDNPNIEGTPGASGCGSTNNYLNGNDVVYSFTADFDGNIFVSLDPTNTYAGIFAYASCEDIGENCIGGAVAGSTTNEIGFELPVENGSTYYFVISTWATPQTTPYTLEITQLLCSAPSALTATNITNESAVLAWTSEGNLFDVEFGETGFIPTGNPTNANTTGVANPFTLEDLTSDTVYQYYVRQDCGTDGTSDWSGPFTFRTECVALTVPTAIQDFSTYTGSAPSSLACWKEATGNFVDGLSGTSSSWTNQNYNNDAAHPNGTAAYINLYGADNEWLISPSIDLGAGSADYQLKYDVSIKPWSGTDPVTNMEEKFVKVVVSTDGGTTWSEAFLLKTYDNNNIPADGGITETLSLANFTGVIKVAFYASSTTTTTDLRFFIDNFSIEVNDPCAGIDAPTGNAFQTLSEGQTLADLVVAGENLTWYSDDNLQNQISSTTVAEDNTTYFVTQTVDECTSEALAVTVEVTLSTGDFNLVSLKAYPNPTSDFVTVSYNNDITNVAVINMLGQTLMTKNVNANTTQIDMTSLPTGNYFVKVTVEGAVKTIKIVKN